MGDGHGTRANRLRVATTSVMPGGTVGLFLMVTTVIAFAVAVAGVSGAPGKSAVVAAPIGALSFAGIAKRE